MATLRNWSLVRVHCSDKRMKTLTTQHNNSSEKNPCFYFAIMGECYGNYRVKEGTFIYTSPIKTMNQQWMITKFGQIYELKDKNPDYEKFEKAVADGITILRDWSIHRENDTCYLKVKDENGVENMKKILSRKDWIVTFEDRSVAFLDWASVNETQLNYLKMFVI